ncbi:MAG: YjgN family protein [Pseudomonadota bacterium]
MPPTLFGNQSAGIPAAGAEPVRIEYVAHQGLGGIAITNFLLNLITLSFYRFWAKTRVRRHIWSSVQINGEPVEYTGTGKELFFGFIVIMAVVFLPVALIGTGLAAYFGPESGAVIAFQLFIGLALVTLYGFAIYRARRYRLSRTVWRGIRGALPGSALSYSGKYFGSLLLSPMTLGWSTPAMNLILAQHITNDMRFGNTPFSFSGRSGPLYLRYALCWFGTIVAYFLIAAVGIALYYSGAFDGLQKVFASLADDSAASGNSKAGEGLAVIAGLLLAYLSYVALRSTIWSFYTARELNIFAQYTRFSGATFEFNATAWSLITLWLGNMALIIFTLGIAQPFVEQRIMRYFVERLSVHGAIDFASIQQSQAQLDRRGEGLIDALDLDAF